MGKADLEMESASSNDKSAESEDKPPPPPKRDYQEESRVPPPRDTKRFSSFQRPEFVPKPELSGDMMGCLKSLLIIINLAIWVFGAVLTGLGIWLKVDDQFWDIQTGLEISKFKDASTVLIVVGVVIMVIGILGCYGAFALKLWMLVLFAIFMTIIIVLEIAVMALVWTASNNKEVQEDIKLHIWRAIQSRQKSESQQYLIDLIQSKLECCGVDGPSDYTTDPKNLEGAAVQESAPPSCMNRETGVPNQQGCLPAIINYLKSKANLLGGIAITVFGLQLAALVFTVCIACSVKQAVKNEIF